MSRGVTYFRTQCSTTSIGYNKLLIITFTMEMLPQMRYDILNFKNVVCWWNNHDRVPEFLLNRPIWSKHVSWEPQKRRSRSLAGQGSIKAKALSNFSPSWGWIFFANLLHKVKVCCNSVLIFIKKTKSHLGIPCFCLLSIYAYVHSC